MQNYDYMFPRDFIAPAPNTEGLGIMRGMNPLYPIVPSDYFDPTYDMHRNYGISGFAGSGFEDPTDYIDGRYSGGFDGARMGAVQDAMSVFNVAEWLFGK